MVMSLMAWSTADSVTVRRLTRSLQDELKRQIFDKSGIERAFTFRLEFAPQDDSASGLPSLVTALGTDARPEN